MLHEFRFVSPVATGFLPGRGEDEAEAACALLADNLDKALFVRPAGGEGETAYFAVMADVDGAQFIARYFYSGIGRTQAQSESQSPRAERRRLACASLQEVEQRLGLAPGALEDGWGGEETVEAAAKRKFRPP